MLVLPVVTEAAVTTLSSVSNCNAPLTAGEPAPPYYAWPEPTDQVTIQTWSELEHLHSGNDAAE